MCCSQRLIAVSELTAVRLSRSVGTKKTVNLSAAEHYVIAMETEGGNKCQVVD